MSTTSEFNQLTISAADLAVDEDMLRVSEASYRRGIAHGAALVGDLVDSATTLGEARRLATRAENMANQFRSLRRHPGRPPILDELRRRLMRRIARP